MMRAATYSCFLSLVLFSSLLIAQAPDSRNRGKWWLTFRKMYPNAAEVDWSVKERTLMVSFSSDKVYFESFFDFEGKWLRTEHIIEYSGLPEKVMRSFIQSVYSLLERGYAYEVELPRKRTIYKIYVYDDQWRELELLFDEKGNVVVEY